MDRTVAHSPQNLSNHNETTLLNKAENDMKNYARAQFLTSHESHIK